MAIDHNKLKEKGWSDEEIEHAKSVFARSEHHKHPKLKILENIMYWLLLALIVMGAIVGAWLIEPFLIVMTKTAGLITIGIIGILYGLLASLLVKDIEDLEPHHHAIITMLVPLSAIATSVLITHRVQRFVGEYIHLSHDPISLGVIFTFGALIPYGISIWRRWKKHGSL